MLNQIRNTILIVAIGMTAHAQTFIKYFNIDSANTYAFSIQTRSNFFYSAGYLDNGSGLGTYLAKFDYSGNLLSSISFRPAQFRQYVGCWSNSLISTSDSGFAMAGYAEDSGGMHLDHLCFTKFDSNGDVQFYKTYDYPNITQFRHFFGYNTIQCGMNYFLTASLQLMDYSYDVVLFKIDSAGTLLQYNSYTTGRHNSPRGLCRLANGNLMIACYSTDDNSNAWQAIDNTCYIEADTDCNLVSMHCTTDQNTNTYFAIDTAFGGGYIGAGSYFASRQQGLEKFERYVIKFDTSFNYIWSTLVGDSSVYNSYNALKQDKGMLYLCGYDVNASLQLVGYSGSLSKMDSAGDVLWDHRYRVPTGIDSDYSSNYLYDLALLPGGGILAVGSWVTGPDFSPLGYQSAGWIVRVNADGCMDDGSCGYTNVQDNFIDKSPLISIAPNPSNGFFSVILNDEVPPFTTIKIYDLLGNEIIQQLVTNPSTEIDISGYAKGPYLYELSCLNKHLAAGKLIIIE